MDPDQPAVPDAGEPDGPPDRPGAIPPYDRAADLDVLGRVDADLAALETALERLDTGAYGTCEVCGEPIGDDLLTALPLRRRCAAHVPPDAG